MPGFFERRGVKFATYITGPRHVRIGLKLSDKPETPTMVELAPLGTCNHGGWDTARLRSIVLEGLAKARKRHGLQLYAAEIHYDSTDTPVYAFAAACAFFIGERVATGGEFPRSATESEK